MKSLIAFVLVLFYHSLPANDTVLSRFKTPDGFQQVKPTTGSFGAWLQALPLKPAGTKTLTYTGKVAATDVYTAAVVDLSVGSQDLQQCADAVMRLRGEYLYSQKRFSEISFNFVSGFKCDYDHYANGYRYQNDHWILKTKKDYSYPTFMRYMMLVFSYAGTLSLEKQLKPLSHSTDIQTGDVFIHGGSPGHCFIVMGVVQDTKGRKKYLLAQSYMPAQNIQVLQYMGNPWFSIDEHSGIAYGELISPAYLRRF